MGGQLGADTLLVGGNLSNAQVLLSNATDSNSSSDKADSLSVVGSVSQTTLGRRRQYDHRR